MKQKTFEESLARLDEILHQLDTGISDLETALALYEEGVGILKYCHKTLENAQRKIEILRGEDCHGFPNIKLVEEKEFKTEINEYK